jgi:hypothetical protein
LTENNGRAASELAAYLRAQHLATVLMPSSTIDDHYMFVPVTADGQITFDDQRYSIPAVGALAAAIRQKINAQ